MTTSNITPLLSWREDFPEAIANLEQHQRDAAVKRARLTLAETPLSIGVMGQVKAGKSSFLNSLLFGGQSLLPEAATPKTANLTRIRHAPTPSFTARFHHPDDWKTIEQQAASGGMDETARAASELVESVRASGVNVAQMLAQSEMTLQADDLAGLMGALNDYVGEDGRLTALVAETELALPLKELIGIEIVDTPGMNDPVVSRTDKTRQYMAQCDVVFFLSRASQFLDASDQNLLTLQLPQKGIKRLVLVSAQMDMAVLDDGFNRKSLPICYDRIVERLSRHAHGVFSGLAEQREKQGYAHTAELLRQVNEPIFSSTHAWIIANQKPAQWSTAVTHSHKELAELSQDHWQTPLQTADWAKMANMAPLLQALQQAIGDKQSLLAQQRTGLESELAAVQADYLQQLRTLAEDRLHALQSTDLASLKTHELTEQAQLDKISAALSGYLQTTIQKAKERCASLTQEISQSASRAGQLEDRTGHTTTSHSYRVSDSTWYKPWSWGSYHYESYSTSSSYRYLAASDAVENLRYYVQAARRQMISAFDDLIAPSTLSAGLRRELLRAIDPASSDFDPKGLRALVESILSGLQLPQLDFEAPDVDVAFSGFSGEIKEHSDMQRLRQKLESEVNALNNALTQRLAATVQDTSRTLDSVAQQLHSQLTARLNEKIARLRTAMLDKENQIQSMHTLMGLIKSAESVESVELVDAMQTREMTQ